MNVENDHFIRVAKETDLLICHFHGAMVHLRYCLNSLVKLLWAEFDLRV